LSAISGQALRQDIAVTGSVDQYGHVQAIGGVNEKIEGFFRVCNESKLTGSQGVMIPKSNVKDLQLSDEVVAAVDDGLFHVWAVGSVSDGIELLTGRPAGVWSKKKESWSDGSIFAACQERLDEMVQLMRKAAKKSDNNASGKTENVNEINKKSIM